MELFSVYNIDGFGSIPLSLMRFSLSQNPITGQFAHPPQLLLSGSDVIELKLEGAGTRPQ
jgi:hypothetical protein